MFYLVSIIFSYILGIISNYYVLINTQVLIILAIITTISYLFKSKSIFNIIFISFLFFVLGYYNCSFQKYIPKQNDISFYTPIKADIDGIVNSEIKKTDKFIMFELILCKVNNINLKIEGNIFVIAENKNTNNLKYGDKILLKGKIDIPKDSYNYGEFSFKEYLSRKNIFSVMNASEIIIIENHYKNDWYSRLIELRKNILYPIYKYFDSDYSNLISSLIFGSKTNPVDKDIENSFRNLGLSHVLAASGMQVVLIINIGYILTFFIKKNSIYQKVIISVPLIFYMFLTDFPASIIRAGFINLLILFLKRNDKVIDTLNTFIFGTLIIILLNPLIILDIGFQFSLLATLGLITLNNTFNEKISFFIPSIISQSISTILSAQIMVLPLQIYYFQEFSLMFLMSNILASLFINLLTYISILIIIFEFTIPTFSYYLSILTYVILDFFLYIINILSLDFLLIKLSKPYLFNIIFSYMLMYCLLIKLKKRVIFIIALLFIFFNTIFGYFNNKYLKIDFLYVGQGNSTFIQTPNKTNILIDCGPKIEFEKNGKKIQVSAGEKTILPFLNRKGIKKIDILIITHPDSDHIGGCEDIIKNVEVKEIWDSYQFDNSRIYSDLLSSILKNNIEIKTKNLNYKEKNINIMAFNLDFKEYEKSYNNNNSLIVDVKFLKNRFLLMSDIELEGENKLIENNYYLKADLLQVGHHGSNTSSSDKFLSKVRPSISVISSGRNNIYKHPHYQALQRIKNFSKNVYRTDEEGQISFFSNGRDIERVF